MQGSGEKIISLATSPTLMSDGLPSNELDRMTMILSERLKEVIERQDVLIEAGKYCKNYSDILARAMLTTCLMGTLLSIFALLLKTYLTTMNRDSPGLHLVWGISLLSFALAVMLSIFVPLVQSFADALGRPISNEHTKWIYRPSIILTGTLLAQGISLLSYLVIAAVWL
ncbi:hypothetical protein RSOLAG22IIIB_10771 [Rhizoctonia solani]|uniref:Uncharacterized protein n=1 Tax=Rhizoctonia solani TaxID=456999 RepID=A0A0K6G502_9AGAM|nr:hypothetical protein RSOLAG22IIIB_10771 [Rhizoctonia solani]